MDALSQTFSALADPTRRAILARLKSGAATRGELGAPFALKGPALSRHLRVLAEAGLIECDDTACALRGERLQDVVELLAFYRDGGRRRPPNGARHASGRASGRISPRRCDS